MEFIGKITEISKMEEVKSSRGTWNKLTFRIEQEGQQYPESLALTLFGDKVEKYPIEVGDVVTAKFNCKCNSYNGRLYNELQVWNLTKNQ